MIRSCIRRGFFTFVSCLVVFLGIWHVAVLFLDNLDHPGWDFTMRHGEVVCLTTIHVDPYDIFSESVHNKHFRSYKPLYEYSDDALDYHWCCGYPPWEYTLMLPFSLFSLQSADRVYKGIELAALVLLVFFSVRRSLRIATYRWKQLLVAYSVFLLPPEAWHFVFRYGNWAVLFCAGVVCLVMFLEKDWQILAGLAWAFLMIKPQQGIWFVIPLVFRRQFKTIGVAVLTCLAASVPPAALCGKNPITLILEIPKMRPEEYSEATLFPSRVFALLEELTFPKAALIVSAMLCFVFCIWATRKLRKEKDWFVFLQPTFFCVCAGYPLWHQDWLYFLFPLLYLLETWAKSREHSPERVLALPIAICLANPPSWLLFDFPALYCGMNPIPGDEFLSLSAWLLLAYLVFVFQNRTCVAPIAIGGEAESVPQNGRIDISESLAGGKLVAYFVVFAEILLFLVFVSFVDNGCFLGVDDADIFFGYAQNLCDGRGITYAMNGTHCEGVTSLLWLFLSSFCFWFRFGEPGVFVLSLALLLASQWIWVNILWRVLPQGQRTAVLFAVYAILLLSSVGYVTWMSIRLMDLVLWGFLISLMTLALMRETESRPLNARERLLFAVPFVLAPWTRPESMLVVPGCLSLAALFRWTNQRNIKSELVWGGSFFVSLAVLIGFRMAYFGYPFPNTYYAKVSPSLLYNLREGSAYAMAYCRSGIVPKFFFLCFCIVVAGVGLRWVRAIRTGQGRPVRSEILWLWSFVLCIPPILTGGDHFAFFRFFQPVWPLMCILVLSIAVSFWNKFVPPLHASRTATVVALAALSLFSFFSGWTRWGGNADWSTASPLEQEFLLAEAGKQDGVILSNMFSAVEEKPVLGVILAGGISRTYQGKIVDLMGLNNEEIAHWPGMRFGTKNHAAFEPELFPRLGVDIMPFIPNRYISKVLKGLIETKEFVELWRCGRIRKAATGEETRPFFVEKGFLDRLLSTGDFSFRDSYRFEGGRWTEIKEAAIN